MNQELDIILENLSKTLFRIVKCAAEIGIVPAQKTPEGTVPGMLASFGDAYRKKFSLPADAKISPEQIAKLVEDNKRNIYNDLQVAASLIVKLRQYLTEFPELGEIAGIDLLGNEGIRLLHAQSENDFIQAITNINRIGEIVNRLRIVVRGKVASAR